MSELAQTPVPTRTRLPVARMASGAVLGLAWACGLRGFMTQVTTTSTVTWAGTFLWILLPSAVIGALLGWAEHIRRTSANPRGRMLVWSPFIFAGVLVQGLITNGLAFHGGIGGGALGVPAIGVFGAYAIAGQRHWARIGCALVAFSVVPIWAFVATGIGGPALGLDRPKGLWVALYLWTFLALLMAACSIPLRIPSDAAARATSR